MLNSEPFTLCSLPYMASVLPFKKENIKKRYLWNRDKVLLYNGMQVISFMEKHEISERDLRIALRSIVATKNDEEIFYESLDKKVGRE